MFGFIIRTGFARRGVLSSSDFNVKTWSVASNFGENHAFSGIKSVFVRKNSSPWDMGPSKRGILAALQKCHVVNSALYIMQSISLILKIPSLNYFRPKTEVSSTTIWLNLF